MGCGRRPGWHAGSSQRRLAWSALAALCVVAACTKETAAPELPSRPVVVEQARRGDAVDRIQLLGEAHGATEVMVFSQMPERIVTLHVRDGDAIVAGEPIVTLASDLSSMDLTQAGAALQAAEASRDQLRAESLRMTRLVADGVVASAQLEALEANLRASEAQVAQLQAARRAAGARQSRTVIRAPVAGTIALLTVSEGDMAVPSVPIAMVVQMATIEIKAPVIERDYGKLRVGLDVNVTAPSLPSYRRQGTLSALSAVIDPRTRSGMVEVSVGNEELLLRPGMIAEVGIEVSRRPNVVLVPAEAVLFTSRTVEDSEGYVFVVVEGRAERRTIHLGSRYDRDIEVIDGLGGDEMVIIRGQNLLRDGASVRIDGTATAREPASAAGSAEGRDRDSEAEGRKRGP